MRQIAISIGFLVFFAWTQGLKAETYVTGMARVIDGDTVEIGELKIRLHGIDTPEIKQRCEGANGVMWACGEGARHALSDKISGREIRCRDMGTGVYGRIIGACFLDKKDLNGWLVAEGWAVAYVKYSEDYANQELLARAAKRGLWSGRFIMPWNWRRGMRLAALVLEYAPPIPGVLTSEIRPKSPPQNGCESSERALNYKTGSSRPL